MIKNYITLVSALVTLIFGVAMVMPINQNTIIQEQEFDTSNNSSRTIEEDAWPDSTDNAQSCELGDQAMSSISWIQIQRHAERQLIISELEDSIARAALTKLAIWHNPHEQTTIYAHHCRNLRYGCEVQVRQFSRYIAEVATQFQIDPWLFAGMAWHESRFNPGAESNMGAVGIFQLLRTGPASRGMHFVHQRRFREACSRNLGVCQRPIVVRAAEWFLASVEQCHGSISGALRAYNSGDCNGPRRYSQAVFEARDDLRAIATRR